MCFSLSVSRACLVICKSARPAKKWYEMGMCISWLCPFNHSQPCQQSVFSPTETCIRIWCTAGTVERWYQRLVSTGFPPFPSLAIFSPFFEHRAWRSSTWESLPLWGLLGICQPVVKWGGIGWAGDCCCLWKCEDWWLSTSQFIGCWGVLFHRENVIEPVHRQIVTRSSTHFVREMNQNPGSKHCFLFWKTLWRRVIWGIFKIS